MTGDPGVERGDEGNEDVPPGAQSIHEVRFFGPSEGGFVYGADCRTVVWAAAIFRANANTTFRHTHHTSSERRASRYFTRITSLPLAL